MEVYHSDLGNGFRELPLGFGIPDVGGGVRAEKDGFIMLAVVLKATEKRSLRAGQRGYVCRNLVMIYEIREVGWVLRAQKDAW